jgi:hypothetical protein
MPIEDDSRASVAYSPTPVEYPSREARQPESMTMNADTNARVYSSTYRHSTPRNKVVRVAASYSTTCRLDVCPRPVSHRWWYSSSQATMTPMARNMISVSRAGESASAMFQMLD